MSDIERQQFNPRISKKLWQVFTTIARSQGMMIQNASEEALLEWCKKNDKYEVVKKELE
ncbi:MAG: hypothetical protein ACTSWQ_00810 [Candidatus Thorarchaeota archaeon]